MQDSTPDRGRLRSSPLRLTDDTVRDLRRANPWWEGQPLPGVPATRRHLVDQIHRRIESQLAPIVVVRGPRQVGKSVAQLQVIQDLLARGGAPEHIFRLQCDELGALRELGRERILRLVDWYEESFLGRTINAVARDGNRVFLFLDEVQNWPDWDVQLKYLVDHTTVTVVVTGSSALRIARGRDSLAGRITTLEAGTLSLTEVGRFRSIAIGDPLLPENQVDKLALKETWLELRERGCRRAPERDRAFAAFSERGGYPIAHREPEIDWALLADQLNESVVRRVIEHDLMVGPRGRGRDPVLLDHIFRLVCRYAGMAPRLALFAGELEHALGAGMGTQRVAHDLRFLADTLLVRLVEPLEIRLKRARGPQKLCLADHALRASVLGDRVPLDPERLEREPHLTAQAGHLAESVVGAALASFPGLDLAWLPERGSDAEVDFVLLIGYRRVPIEVKYQRTIDRVRDTLGLRQFVEKSANNATFGVMVTQADAAGVDDPRIVALPLSSFLMLR